VRVWDAATGEKVLSHEGHMRGVKAAVYSPDGARVASGSNDGTVRIWDAVTGEVEVVLSLQGRLWMAVASPQQDTKAAVAGSSPTRAAAASLPDDLSCVAAKQFRNTFDMLESVSSQCADALSSDQPDRNGLRAVVDALKTAAEELMSSLGSLTGAEAEAVHAALNEYLPSDDGSAARKLDAALESRTHATATAAAGGAYQHPMRVARLRFGLLKWVWTTVPSFFGQKVTGSNYELSHDADHCSFFVSHSWRDRGDRKVAMLREVLFLQDFSARAIVVLVLLAAFVTPLGFPLAAYIPGLYWWVLPAAPLGLLVLLLAWIGIGLLGLLPSAITVWSLSTTTIWIDKLCINQESDETKAAGVAGFKRFLGQCDRMVAFISPSYFTRLWCVYELASFTKKHGMHESDSPSGKLLLLSLDWPSSFSPLKRARVSEAELDWIRNFSCRDAQCFKPADRAFVLESIRNDFGSETAFDTFVRTHLPALLERSKREYAEKVLSAGSEAGNLIFGA